MPFCTRVPVWCDRQLIIKSTATQMKWLVCIIMKNLPLGKSAESILRSYHPDAPDEHAACMDLEKVGRRCGKCGSGACSAAESVRVVVHALVKCGVVEVKGMK